MVISLSYIVWRHSVELVIFKLTVSDWYINMLIYFKTMGSFQMNSGNFKLIPFRYIFVFLIFSRRTNYDIMPFPE
jgi:hypothetical protein